jgi:dsDNA-specific endonuclease/ATPase MutS2
MCDACDIKQVCKAVLQRARPGALVLMDEMGSGTDPAQGVALAQVSFYTRNTHLKYGFESLKFIFFSRSE